MQPENENPTTLYIMAGDKMIEMPGLESVELECGMPNNWLKTRASDEEKD